MDKEKMININASLVEEPVFSSFEKDGEEVKERAKEDKVFKNFIVKSLNKTPNKNKNEDNKEEK